MIFYLATEPHLKGMRTYLQNGGESLVSQMQLCAYESWLEKPKILPGSYIFSDIERLTIAQLKQVGQRFNELACSSKNHTLLNHPLKIKRRYEFLRSLYLNRINNFNVYRQTELRVPDKFPVFVRGENDHTWDSLELFYNNTDLNNYLQQRESRGFSREDTLITEFCDTKDNSSIYRKYSAFIVGDTIIPRHVVFRTNWMVKRPELYNAELMEEELDYVKQNPHQKLLQPIFALAGINYGRIDYAFCDGRIQVWEINTNPSISTFSKKILDEDPRRQLRLEAHCRFVKEFNSALQSLESHSLMEIIKKKLKPSLNFRTQLKTLQKSANNKSH